MMEFIPVEDPLIFESLLLERLPLSTNVYNVMRLEKAWPGAHKWFSILDPTVEELWIVVVFRRQDYGQHICVSRPLNAKATDEIRSAFSNCSFLNWNDSYAFCCIDPVVSSIVTDISIREKGNLTVVYPCHLFYLETEKARELPIDAPTNVEVKPIDSEEGRKFLLKTWKYVKRGSDAYIAEALQRNLSAGVYSNGEIVAGVLLERTGVIGMLYCLKEFRGKGYGKLTMQYMMKISAEKQFVPGCTVESRNEASKAFQEKIGFKFGGIVDFVKYQKAEY